MRTLINPTPAQRAAHRMLCELYRRDLDARQELRIPLPDNHPTLVEALRQLDRQVGFCAEADDVDLPAGEGCHRWAYFHASEVASLTQEDLMTGSSLADGLLAVAAWTVSGRTPAEVVERAIDKRMGWEPRGPVPRG